MAEPSQKLYPCYYNFFKDGLLWSPLNNTLITDTFECLCRVNVDLDVLVRPMPGTVRLVQGLDEVNNSRFLHPSRRRIGMVTNAILFTYYFRPLSNDFAATSKTEFPKP